jgi:hypothetical protein
LLVLCFLFLFYLKIDVKNFCVVYNEDDKYVLVVDEKTNKIINEDGKQKLNIEYNNHIYSDVQFFPGNEDLTYEIYFDEDVKLIPGENNCAIIFYQQPILTNLFA